MRTECFFAVVEFGNSPRPFYLCDGIHDESVVMPGTDGLRNARPFKTFFEAFTRLLYVTDTSALEVRKVMVVKGFLTELGDVKCREISCHSSATPGSTPGGRENTTTSEADGLDSTAPSAPPEAARPD